MKIVGFTVWLVEADPGPKFIWRDGLPGSHGDIPAGTRPRKAVLRMETDSGVMASLEIELATLCWTLSPGAITRFWAKTR